MNSVGDLSANSLTSNSLRNIGNTFSVNSVGDLSANSLTIAGYPLSYYINTAAAINSDISGDLIVAGVSRLNGGINVNSGKLVSDTSGNLTTLGTLSVGGTPSTTYIGGTSLATLLSTAVASSSTVTGDLTVGGLSRLNGGINVNTGKLTVTSAGDLSANSLHTVGDRFYVTSAGDLSANSLTSNSLRNSGNTFYVTSDGDLSANSLHTVGDRFYVTSDGDLSANSLHTVGDRFYVTSDGDLSANSVTSNSLRNSGNTFYVTSAGDLSANSLHTVGDRFYVTSAGDLSANSLHTVGDRFYVTSAGDLSANSLHTVGDRFYVTSAGDLSANSLHTVGDRFYVTSAGDLSANSLTSNSLRNSSNRFYVTTAGDLSANSLHTVGDRFYVTSAGDLSANSLSTKGNSFTVNSAGSVSTNNGNIQLNSDGTKENTLVVIGDPIDGGTIIRGDGSIQLDTVYLSSENGIFSANGKPIMGSRSFTTDLSASGTSNFNGALNILKNGKQSVYYDPVSTTLSVADSLIINNNGTFTATAGSASINVGTDAVRLTNATARNLSCTDGAIGNTPGGPALVVTQGAKAFKPIMTVGSMSGINSGGASFAMNGNMYVKGEIVCTGKFTSGPIIEPALTNANVSTIDLTKSPYGITVGNLVNLGIANTPRNLSTTATLADVINAVNILIANQNNLIKALQGL